MGTPSDGTTRRAYLGATGVALATMVAGCGGKSAPSKESVVGPYRDRFEEVIDVGESNVDDTGTETVDSAVNESIRDGALLYFPPGTYRLSNLDLSGRSNCGFVGNDATLLVPPEEQGNWIYGEPVRNVLFDGFTFDYTDPTATPVVAFSVTGKKNVLRDIEFEGHHGATPRSGLELEVPKRSASLLVERVRMRGGSTKGNGIFTHSGEGSLQFVDCRVEHWAEGLYASPHSGPLLVRGGTYANNGIDQIRIGGGTSGARVENATARVDNPRNAAAKPNMRGIWLEEGTNAVVDNCTVEITDLTGTYSSGGIVVETQFGTARITNTASRRTVAFRPSAFAFRPPNTTRPRCRAWTTSRRTTTSPARTSRFTVPPRTEPPSCSPDGTDVGFRTSTSNITSATATESPSRTAAGRRYTTLTSG